MTRTRSAVALVALALGACFDGTGPGGGAGRILVSEPVGASAAGLSGALSLSIPGSGTVYVALPPGSVPNGVYAAVRNLVTGTSNGAPMLGDGLDPLPVPADIGDVLQITITIAGGSPLSFEMAVTAARPPVVVRTEPPPRKRDVPLNGSLYVVFSEPVDLASAIAAIHLEQNGADVAVRLELPTDSGYLVRVIPLAPLALETEYQLIVGGGVHDLSGDSIPAPYTTSFTTLGGSPPQLRFVSISTNSSSTCGLTAVGAAWCWGSNYRGELGVGGTSSPALFPVPVWGGIVFKSLSVGDWATCGVAIDGIVHCWGYNSSGQLGTGGYERWRLVPTPVYSNQLFATVEMGDGLVCARTAAGAAWCWGRNEFGSIGDNTTDPRPAPTAVSGSLLFQDLAVGGAHACGHVIGDEVRCWGSNAYGQLGVSGTMSKVPVNTDSAPPTQRVLAGSNFTCSLATDGRAVCWGGLASPGDSLHFTMLTAGGTADQSGHACGLTADGTAYCWGRNMYGQLGQGHFTNPAGPAPVVGGLKFVTIDAGWHATCGIATDGLAYCWGDGSEGMFGDGNGGQLQWTAVPTKVGLQ